MLMDKPGHFCLTTLEYVFQGTTNSLTTQCPSCGLRLVIRYDNIVNRATSLGFIIGISALIGYHIGANKQWIKQFARKIFRFVNSNDDQPETSFDASPGSKLNIRKYRNGQQQQASSQQDELIISPYHPSDSASDSAVDFYLSDHEDFDEHLNEVMAYDRYYDELFHNNSQPDSYSSYQSIHSKTVDKIDKVLHQIDDIKKSIVEIDDELYHVTGSKYASFNPDFLTLTDLVHEELFVDENQSNRRTITSRQQQHHHQQQQAFNQLNQQLVRHPQSNHRQRRHNSRVSIDRSLVGASGDQQAQRAQSQRRQSIYSADAFGDDNQTPSPSHQQQSSSLLQRELSRLSFGSIDSNLQQLEWDESECDFYFYSSNADATAASNQSSQSLAELASSEITSAESISNDETAAAKTSPTSSSSLTNETPMMTDEQKLKSMQELLEEAKRLGLLNTIIDACLHTAHSPPSSIKIRKLSTNSSSTFISGDDNELEEDEDEEEEDEAELDEKAHQGDGEASAEGSQI